MIAVARLLARIVVDDVIIGADFAIGHIRSLEIQRRSAGECNGTIALCGIPARPQFKCALVASGRFHVLALKEQGVAMVVAGRCAVIAGEDARRLFELARPVQGKRPPVTVAKRLARFSVFRFRIQSVAFLVGGAQWCSGNEQSCEREHRKKP